MRERVSGALRWALFLCLGLAPGQRARGDVDVRLFLIGDTGKAAEPEPVLVALRRELEKDPARSLAVFLGDNVYPRGLRAPGHPTRAESERRLERLLRGARESGARFLFVPGNHDWDQHGADGWNAVRRQAAHVQEHGGPRVRFEPQGGCPGPVPIEVGERLLLVALDTQWWLHPHAKPEGPGSGCAAATPDEITAALKDVVGGAGSRHVVLVSHHPPLSAGGHGGHFGWKDHIFPLRAAKGWLWLPLPVIGSAYPLARQGGAFVQDLTSTPYKRMISAISGALAGSRPLAWAAGHEHNLQVLAGTDTRYVLVSGSGIFGHTSALGRLPQTRFGSRQAGFMRLEIGTDGALQLAVMTVDSKGLAREAYSTVLE